MTKGDISRPRVALAGLTNLLIISSDFLVKLRNNPPKLMLLTWAVNIKTVS